MVTLRLVTRPTWRKRFNVRRSLAGDFSAILAPHGGNTVSRASRDSNFISDSRVPFTGELQRSLIAVYISRARASPPISPLARAASDSSPRVRIAYLCATFLLIIYNSRHARLYISTKSRPLDHTEYRRRDAVISPAFVLTNGRLTGSVNYRRAT